MKLLTAILSVALLLGSAQGAEKTQPLPQPSKPAAVESAGKPADPGEAVAAASPAPNPKKKRSFFKFLFGGKQKPEPQASPSPAPSPSPTPAESKASKKRSAKAQPTPAPTQPEPAKTSENAKPARKNSAAPVASIEALDAERERFQAAREKALQDPGVRELQDKADTALEEEPHRAALKAYYKALYGKIRELDPSLKERADALEAKALENASR